LLQFSDEWTHRQNCAWIVSQPESLSLQGIVQRHLALPLSESVPVSIVIGTFIIYRPAVFKAPGSVNHKETGRN